MKIDWLFPNSPGVKASINYVHTVGIMSEYIRLFNVFSSVSCGLPLTHCIHVGSLCPSSIYKLSSCNGERADEMVYHHPIIKRKPGWLWCVWNLFMDRWWFKNVMLSIHRQYGLIFSSPVSFPDDKAFLGAQEICNYTRQSACALELFNVFPLDEVIKGQIIHAAACFGARQAAEILLIRTRD